jgi:HEPN domain-containing protein
MPPELAYDAHCYEAVTEEDHQQAVAAAERVLAWARGIVSRR